MRPAAQLACSSPAVRFRFPCCSSVLHDVHLLTRAPGASVSIISGDVHLCGIGSLHSWPRSPFRPPRNDWRLMLQVGPGHGPCRMQCDSHAMHR